MVAGRLLNCVVIILLPIGGSLLQNPSPNNIFGYQAIGWFRVKGTEFVGDRFKFVFFGPKPVSWTTWGALTPILALPGPFKGVVGPRVGSGAPGEPNFPNKQIDPIFLISLFLLNLIGQKRYTFDVCGQKWAPNSQNWPKIAKNSYTHMVIFWKILTSDLAENRLKYVSRTTLHFDIGLGWSVHEKFFTMKKLRFVVPLGCPLG